MRKQTKTRLDMNKIARGLWARRGGKITAPAGYFGAMQVLADVQARFQVPPGGGRRTDPAWTERRLVPLSRRTLERLERITTKARRRSGVNVEPMQMAALLLEKMTEQLSVNQAEKLVQPRRLRRVKPPGREADDLTVADLASENRD